MRPLLEVSPTQGTRASKANMLKLFRHPSLTKYNIQLLQGALIALIIAVLATAFGFGRYQENLMQQQTALVGEAQQASALGLTVRSLQIDVIQVQQFLQDVSATRGLDGLDSGFKEAESFSQSFASHLAAVKTQTLNLNLKNTENQLSTIEKVFNIYYAAGVELAKAYVAEGPAGGNQKMEAFDKQATQLDEALSLLISDVQALTFQANAKAEKLKAETLRAQEIMAIVGVIVAAFATLVGGLVFYFTARLQKQAKQQQQEALRLQQERAQLAEEQAERTQQVIAQLGDGLKRLSDGDLSHQLHHSFPESYEVLRRSFNAAATDLAQTIKVVKTGADRIHSSSNEIAKASQDLSRRTESQAASLEEASAAVSEVLGTVKKTAGDMVQAAQGVRQVRESVGHGSDAAKNAIKAMEQISSQSNEIQQFLGMIDEIAFQTNLLALNAGVEAARAGEAGRGFAIVAMEVRNLAQKTSSAASEIKQLLETSGRSITEGVRLVRNTDEAISSILKQIQDVATVIEKVNELAQAQTTSLAEVSTTVQHMDGVTQQNAAMAEETNAATTSLAQHSDELADAVGRFNVRLAS